MSALLLAVGLSLGVAVQVFATELPPGVLSYIRQKDPQVKVRFDGVVMFSHGDTYVPVFPQDLSLSPDPQQVVANFPAKAKYPDLIQFDNNFFLMRLIQTASGRLTFPKMAEYPIQLKEGLLPQDFLLPDNLYIPVELKVILGGLPYNPGNEGPAPKTGQAKPQQSNSPKAGVSSGSILVNGAPTQEFLHQLKSTSKLTYVFDLTEQKLLGIDTVSGRKQADVQLDCVPSSLKLSTDGQLLFAPCLSTNELVVVDTGANLVKTRIPVGQRPDATLYLPASHQVIVSNRFSPYLSVVNSIELVSSQKIDLPGNGGALAVIPGTLTPQIAVADAFEAKIYLLDLNSRLVSKTLTAIEDMSALQAFRDVQGKMTLWAISRTKNQLVVIDPDSDKILRMISLGAKPVDMAVYDDKTYIVCAGANQVDVVDRASRSISARIPLESGDFPAGLVVMNDEKRAYVITAAANSLVVLNLDNNTIQSTLPVDFRASMIATVSVPKEPAADPVFKAASESVGSHASAEKVKRFSTKSGVSAASTGLKPERKHFGFWGRQDVSTKPVPVSSQHSAAPSSSTPPTSNLSSGGLSSTRLYPESPGKFRLMLGGKSKTDQTSPLLSPQTNPANAAKAGARMANPNASRLLLSPSSRRDSSPVSPTDQPGSMLMMETDLQK
jgi:DNA-binding beta-propeller fold protein YncE